MQLKNWQKLVIVAVIVFAFWWMFVKKSGYSLCNLAEYNSDIQPMVMAPGTVQSVADISVPAATVASTTMGPAATMGSSAYRARGGCGCGK